MSGAGQATRLVVAYHSVTGNTEAVAKAVRDGAASVGTMNAALVDVTAGEIAWDIFHVADAIIFGCPTHFGTISAEIKAFQDATCPSSEMNGTSEAVIQRRLLAHTG